MYYSLCSQSKKCYKLWWIPLKDLNRQKLSKTYHFQPLFFRSQTRMHWLRMAWNHVLKTKEDLSELLPECPFTLSEEQEPLVFSDTKWSIQLMIDQVHAIETGSVSSTQFTTLGQSVAEEHREGGRGRRGRTSRISSAWGRPCLWSCFGGGKHSIWPFRKNVCFRRTWAQGGFGSQESKQEVSLLINCT